MRTNTMKFKKGVARVEYGGLYIYVTLIEMVDTRYDARL